MSAVLPPAFALALVQWVFPAALSLVIATDLIRRVIPNAAVLVLAAGFALLCLCGAVPDAAVRLLSAAGVLVAGFALFARDIVGAGDAKLAGALALWLDPGQLPLFALVCGALGLLLVLVAAFKLQRGSGGAFVPTLPYGVALAGAGLLLFPQSVLMAGPL